MSKYHPLFAEYAASELTRIRRCTSASVSDGRVTAETCAQPIITLATPMAAVRLAVFVIAPSLSVRITLGFTCGGAPDVCHARDRQGE